MQTLFKLLRISFVLLLALAFSFQSVPSVMASSGRATQVDEIRTGYNHRTGMLSFLGTDPQRPISIDAAEAPGLLPEERAKAMISSYANQFGLRNAKQELSLTSTNVLGGREVTRFQQTYQGIPVMGGELIVDRSLTTGGLISINGEISPNLKLDTTPSISAKDAQQTALAMIAKWNQLDQDKLTVSDAELTIYDPRLIAPEGETPVLAWRLEVSAKDSSTPLRELVLVEAQHGRIALHFNQIDTFWKMAPGEKVRPLNTAPSTTQPVPQNASPGTTYKTYTAGGSTSLPGTLLCTNSSPTICAGVTDSDAVAAHRYAAQTDNFYYSEHGRRSIDNNSMPIVSTVHYGVGYQNAFWNGSQMVYGDGFSQADDVVGHELTHGVTERESGLFYYYQSGAINESLSDVWGELLDQSNGWGTDTAAVRWLMGEDVPGFGAIRNMKNPPAFGDPDAVTSPYYFTDWWDNGGVHFNSGVNNKAAYLLVDGGTFRGRTVTALGSHKTLDIYYEAQTNLLTSGADYYDLYFALYQACLNLVGTGGITSSNCQEVRDATNAVAMAAQPISNSNFNTDAPKCTNGSTPIYYFNDDLESGTANWSFTNGTYTRWQYGSPYGNYAHSGTGFLYANDYPATTTDAYATLKAVDIPANAYLHFSHAYGFEFSYDPNTGEPTGYYYDGGVLEYSADGGPWTDASPLMEANGYSGVLSAGNPLGARSAFVGESHGYIGTRLNLSSLDGKSVAFRWRMGLDSSVYWWGWWLDDVQIYTCGWVGGVKVESTGGEVVAVGRPHVGSQVMTYNGFTSGSLNAYVPMLFKNAFGGSYDSALYIQNVDPSNTANITIRFYDNNGSQTYSMTDTLSPLASKGYWLPSIAGLGASWVGGVKVESNRNIVAVGRPHIGGEVTSYDGFSAGSPNAYVPMLFKDAFGGSYDSALYIQNVDPSNTANITIHFYDSSGNETYSMNDAISPLASKGYWLPSIAGLGASWVGGVKVESDRNIVAVGRPHVGAQVMTYNGFTSGSMTAYVPMLFKDAFGGSYDAALYVQNLDLANSADITIKYYDTSGNLVHTANDTIAALASKGYWLPGISQLPVGWVGSAVITANRQIVAVSRPHVGSEVMTYQGSTVTGANNYLSMLFNKAFGNYNSAVYLQNTSSSLTANITLRFYDTSGNLTCTKTDSLLPNATGSYWLPTISGCPPF